MNIQSPQPLKIQIFFEELHNQAAQNPEDHLTLDNSTRLTKNSRNGSENNNEVKEGPNVHGVLNSSSADAPPTAARKATIGQRKPAGKLGAKKVGLGAQKVKQDFTEIEREAQMQDQMKERRVEDERVEAEQREKDEEKQMASRRLAIQDLTKQQKHRDEQLKHMDPKKAEQVERLGMGIGVRTGVSHSAMCDMKTIEQDTPSSSAYSSVRQPKKNSDFFDEMGYLESSFGGVGFSSKKSSSSDWVEIDKLPKYSKPAEDDYSNTPVSSSKPSRSYRGDSGNAPGDEAQKKFGNAKAISSDQFFGAGQDNDFERRTNLSRFDGKNSISSADYFGDGHQRNQQQQSSFQSPLQNVDLDDVKESVRQGVTKVAGKLSNLANGVMSSFQEKYGY